MEKVAESWTGVCAATLPSANHIVVLGDKIGRAPEIQVRKRFAKPAHEHLDILATPARLVQGELQQHIGCCKFVDDFEIAVPQNSVNQRPTIALFSISLLI